MATLGLFFHKIKAIHVVSINASYLGLLHSSFPHSMYNSGQTKVDVILYQQSKRQQDDPHQTGHKQYKQVKKEKRRQAITH